jgi:predicted phosphohydrolase
MRKFLKEYNFDNIDFLYNNSYFIDDYIICGTRGWVGTNAEENKKILKREKQRLELSLEDGIKKYGIDKKIVVCTHYPPFNDLDGEEYNFINTMKKYNVEKCIYGHLHGMAHKDAKEGLIEGIEFKLVSSDYLDFKLMKL